MSKHHSEKLKIEIVNKYMAGNGSLYSLGEQYEISPKTIFKWVKNTKKLELLLTMWNINVVDQKNKI